MTRKIRGAVLLLAMATTAASVPGSPGSPGAPGAPGDDPHNAATWYRRAFERLRALPPDDWDTIVEYAANRSAAPSQRLRELLAESQPALDLLRRATQESQCDYELDYSQGFSLLMPHISASRRLARIAMADAMVRLHDGDSAAASERLGTLYQMSDQLRGDGVVISALVGCSIFRQADSGTQFALDHGSLTAADGARLLAATESIDSTDPFGLINSLAGEKENFIGWAMQRYSGEGGVDRFKEEVAGGAMDPNGRDLQFVEVAITSQAQLDSSFEKVDALMQRAIDAFRLPDPIDARFELEQINKEIERGDVGVAVMLMPGFDRLYSELVASREALAERKATLKELAEGTATPAQLINAAIGYLEAIAALDALDPAKLAVIDWIAVVGKLPPDQEPLAAALEALDAAGPIIDTLRDASLKRRCDFSIAGLERPSAVLAYAAGMREATRLLHADAVHRAYAGETDAAIDRLAIALRAGAHLAGDKAIISSLTAHTMFTATTRRIEALSGKVELSDEQRLALLAAAKLSARRDVFGYARAVESDRKAVAGWVLSRPAGAAAQAVPVRDLVKQLDGDRLLYLSAVADALRRPDADLTVALLRFGDVISPEKFAEAQTSAAEIQSLLADGKFDEMSTRQAPRIGRVEQRMAEAPADLRAALAMLKPAPRSEDPAPGP